MELKQICMEILNEAKKNNIKDLKTFNKVKLQVLNRHNCKKIPKNATIASLASEKDRKIFKKILSMKPVRTISGVAPIALMTDPYPCPHTIKGIGPCTYCPGGPGSVFGDVPQSYTGKEPSTRRAIRNHYDPYLGVFNRLEHYVAMGAVPEKTEVILQGGTFNFFPYSYQEYFTKYLLKAMNDFSRLFYSKNGVDKNKFNKFFEMPADIEDDGRTESIHRKLFFIKNLDLTNKKVMDSINNLFFSGNNFNEIWNGPKNRIIKQWEKYNEEKNNENNNLITIDNRFYKNNPFKNIDKNNNSMSYKDNNLKTINNGKIKINDKNPNTAAMKNVIKKVNEQTNHAFTLEKVQNENETARIRCVGLTIETKSDYGKLQQGNQMLGLGCTRVEIGIQSIYDEVLEKTNRGNSVKENIESIRILKDLGFKINAHYMPGLPFTTKEMDQKGMKELFENPDYKPDMLKIYPCMVMPGTKLYDDWKAGKFKPLTTKGAAELIADFMGEIPTYTRVMRLQRDIPSYLTSAGVDKTNLRQYVEKIMKEKGIKCRDIRSREIGHYEQITGKKISLKDVDIIVKEYEASKGKEFFISAEDIKNDVLVGFVRLRFPSQFLREEITETSALIRELHVFSEATSIGKLSKDSYQHRGIGKSLMKKAEEITRQNGKTKVVVISGIGVRLYFTQLGYKRNGPYMSKFL